MISIFENIISKESLFVCLIGANIISSCKTRLGGQIMHLQLTSQEQAFAKVGTGFEKLEIMREYKNITALQGYFGVPKVYGYVSTNDEAVIVLEKMPGLPLHSMISSLGRKCSLLIIKNIMDALSAIPKSAKDNFEIAYSLELKDIKSLIDNNLIRQGDFIKQSGGLSPQNAYIKIKGDLNNHTLQTMTHGDLCLPNILVTPKGEWSLIDWGKGGLGDRCRDLSALSGSISRNIDEKAFPQVCEMMNIEITLDFRQKLDLYKLMDIFWHNAIM